MTLQPKPICVLVYGWQEKGGNYITKGFNKVRVIQPTWSLVRDLFLHDKVFLKVMNSHYVLES